jgi:glycoside/pentoside/hexuronide:cation symporter, GPH family
MTQPVAAALVAAPEVPAPAATSNWRGGWAQGLAYGGLGLPLAFVALPLYVVLPNHYAANFGVPLATLGFLLLGARLLDALVDPLIGRWADRWFGQSPARVWAVAVVAAVVLALGFWGLFFPAVGTAQLTPLLLWCALMLAVTYTSYSVLSVVHQAWGARLGGDEAQRARIVSWREGLALVGVLVASVLPSVAGLGLTTVVFAVALAVGVVALRAAPQPLRLQATAGGPALGTAPSLWQPLATPAFRRLLLVYLVNGVASAVPATLVLFFVRDQIQAQAWEPVFLGSFFAAGALTIPLWLRAVARWGLARTWLLGMGLSVLAFVGAATLGAGDVWPYLAVCVASGAAFGADLCVPSALLAGVIQKAGHSQRLEGAYFGWWNFATKLNLALAAGIALPLLAQFGYAPGARGAGALQALTVAYCLLPCALKLAAAFVLWSQWLQKETRS